MAKRGAFKIQVGASRLELHMLLVSLKALSNLPMHARCGHLRAVEDLSREDNGAIDLLFWDLLEKIERELHRATQKEWKANL